MSKTIPDYVHQHFAAHKDGTIRAAVVPQITCADHTTLSVQASEGHYCWPSSDTGPWTHVEVWLVCSAKGKKIVLPSFGSDHTNPYGWVPVELVNKFIHRHGGLLEEA